MLEKMLNQSCINCLRYGPCSAPLDYKLTLFLNYSWNHLGVLQTSDDF